MLSACAWRVMLAFSAAVKPTFTAVRLSANFSRGEGFRRVQSGSHADR
jgi:hypothetical protein